MDVDAGALVSRTRIELWRATFGLKMDRSAFAGLGRLPFDGFVVASVIVMLDGRVY